MKWKVSLTGQTTGSKYVYEVVYPVIAIDPPR
jgi:hypothetical protein